MDYTMMPTKDDDFDINVNNNNNNNNNNSSMNNFNSDVISNNSNSNSSVRMQNQTATMSKAELRKSNKPIMEKRRRARINHCLNELKSLILEAMKKDPARHTKLEKADILEMTVKHLQSIQRQQLSLAIQTDPNVIHKFKSGFSECAEEVTRYIGQLDNIETGVKQRLSNHLNSCVTGLDQIGPFNNLSTSFRTTTASTTPTNLINQQYHNTATNSFQSFTQDINNNNGRIQMGGVQLIPSRLSSGEIALIMPNSNNIPFFQHNLPTSEFSTIQQQQQQQTTKIKAAETAKFQRLSAFTKPLTNLVVRSSIPTTTTATSSPPLSPVSSISSLGDESMHTSVDFQSKTPPLNQSTSSGCSNSFYSTPSSAECSMKFFSPVSGHLQQHQVTSTSELKNFIKMENDVILENRRKRCRNENSNDSFETSQSAMKVLKSECNEKNGNLIESNENPIDGTNDMWRPW